MLCLTPFPPVRHVGAGNRNRMVGGAPLSSRMSSMDDLADELLETRSLAPSLAASSQMSSRTGAGRRRTAVHGARESSKESSNSESDEQLAGVLDRGVLPPRLNLGPTEVRGERRAVTASESKSLAGDVRGEASVAAAQRRARMVKSVSQDTGCCLEAGQGETVKTLPSSTR